MFALLFGKHDQAERARAVLEAEGYEVELQTQADGWVVVAGPQPVACTTEATMARMHSLARDLGGEVLGHGGLGFYGLG